MLRLNMALALKELHPELTLQQIAEQIEVKYEETRKTTTART
jgi:hypothetical protein